MALRCAVLGTGNIGTDLMVKTLRSPTLELVAFAGIDPNSDGLARARDHGVWASADGIDAIEARAEKIDLVFDATSAAAHRAHAATLARLGIRCLDLTPAKLGPGVVPVVNLASHPDAADINLVSCGGQATIPIVAAVAQAASVPYAEIISTISSASAGPGTRQSIDEFTKTTARGLEEIGGARTGKAIIILNPAEPPLLMRNTVFCALDGEVDQDLVSASIYHAVTSVRDYVPGYCLATEPVFERGRVAVFIEVQGAGDYLPAYAGNLDIMTAAAIRVAEELARSPQTLSA